MSTIFDYLEWRGDLPLSEDAPLNELDAVILSRFSNLPFSEVYHSDTETMGSFCDVMARFDPSVFQLEDDVRFVKDIAKSRRFSDLYVTDFVKDNRLELEMQFSAVTIHLPGDILFLSFCGTDATLLGWKENFNMSFQDNVPAQCAALSYAAYALKCYPEAKGFYFGGHSKGGNLATYAAVCLPKAYRPLVLGVFSCDGPGFSKPFIATHDFEEMADRMHTFLPTNSMVGRILEHAENYEVVESEVDDLNQHDLYTWCVEPLRLVRAETTSDSSDLFYHSVRHLVEETTPKQRELVLAGAYGIACATEYSTMREVSQDFASLLTPLYHEVRGMNREDWQVLSTVMKAFLDAYVHALRDVGRSKVPPVILELRNSEDFEETSVSLMDRAVAAWKNRKS